MTHSQQNGRLSGKWATFPPEEMDAMSYAVDTDDIVDARVSLPERIVLNPSDQQIFDCYSLSLQFWTEGAPRRDLIEFVRAMQHGRGLSDAERARYKDIRARYKVLRFALTLFATDHGPPFLLQMTVGVMGNLQDAVRYHHRWGEILYGTTLRLLLSRPLWALVRRKVHGVRMETAPGFAAYCKAEMGRVKRLLDKNTLTGHEFHALRKIISRQVAYYNAAHVLCPNDHDYRIIRFLAAINGLMGDRHDVMVEQAMTGAQRYETPVALDADLCQRFRQLLDSYPL